MGRHSAPDDYGDGDDAVAAVLSAPPAGSRPKPGRHSRGDDQPSPGGRPPAEGLDVIETVLAGGDDSVPAEDESSTAQIEPIVDPILDQPVPSAETTQLPAVIDAAPVEDAPDTASPAPDAEPTPDADGKADAKAAAKAAKQADKQRRKAERAAAKTQAAPKPEPAAEAKVSDLALLRTDSAARARVVAAVVVPFVLYVGVLAVVGALDVRTTLIWIWVPLITAGIVAGLILDLAHRAAAARALDELERRQTDPA